MDKRIQKLLGATIGVTALISAGAALSGCEESQYEEAAEETEEAAEETGEAVEETAEEAAEEMDEATDEEDG